MSMACMNAAIETFEDAAEILEPAPEDVPFHIGQAYDRAPATRLACRRCHGTAFEVAQGDYFTAVRCVVCRWEACVHDG